MGQLISNVHFVILIFHLESGGDRGSEKGGGQAGKENQGRIFFNFMFFKGPN